MDADSVSPVLWAANSRSLLGRACRLLLKVLWRTRIGVPLTYRSSTRASKITLPKRTRSEPCDPEAEAVDRSRGEPKVLTLAVSSMIRSGCSSELFGSMALAILRSRQYLSAASSYCTRQARKLPHPIKCVLRTRYTRKGRTVQVPQHRIATSTEDLLERGCPK
jgi:hypothetical protein